LPELLAKAPGANLSGTMQEEQLEPLGSYRLMIARLVYQILKMDHATLNEELLSNDVFIALSNLIKKHPWNNFFQLRIISIYEEVLQNSKNAEFRLKVL
jgi:hypothetical protein